MVGPTDIALPPVDGTVGQYAVSIERQSVADHDRDTLDTAIDRRRQLRHLNIDPAEHDRRRLANIDTNLTLAAATGHGTDGTPVPDQHNGDVTRRLPRYPDLTTVGAEEPTVGPDLEQADEPALDNSNAQLRSQLAAAHLRTVAIDRSDDGLGLDL